MNYEPFIHTFKASSGFYFYDVNTDKIVSISSELYELLEKKEFDYLFGDNLEEFTRLKIMGFFKNNRVKLTRHPLTNHVESILAQRLSSIVLQVTQNCNLRCEYCVYSGTYNNRTHCNSIMSEEMAFKSIDFLKSHSSNVDVVDIGFYGGEPLLEFGLIKKCIEYSEKIFKDKTIHFSMTTNATLLTMEMFEYFREHNLTLTISLDGPSYIHDRYRKFYKTREGSHKYVYSILKRICEKYPEDIENYVIVNVVVDQSENFKEVNEFFCKDNIFKLFQVTLSLINDDYSKCNRSSSDTFVRELNYELFKMYLKMFGRIKENNVSPLLHTNEIMTGVRRINRKGRIGGVVDETSHHGGPCVPGQKSLFIDTKGDFFPCEKVPENNCLFKIGDLKNGFNMKSIVNMLNIESCMTDTCHNCWAYDYCTICVATSNCINRFDEDVIRQKCGMVRNEVEGDFKHYCLLIENGYDFDTKMMKKGRFQYDEFNYFADDQK